MEQRTQGLWQWRWQWPALLAVLATHIQRATSQSAVPILNLARSTPAQSAIYSPGTDTYLQCTFASASGQIDISWSRGMDRAIRRDIITHQNRTSSWTSSAILFTKFEADDVGAYTCMAQNDAYSSSIAWDVQAVDENATTIPPPTATALPITAGTTSSSSGPVVMGTSEISPSEKQSSLGTILVAALGAVAGLLVVATILMSALYWKRHRKERKFGEGETLLEKSDGKTISLDRQDSEVRYVKSLFDRTPPATLPGGGTSLLPTDENPYMPLQGGVSGNDAGNQETYMSLNESPGAKHESPGAKRELCPVPDVSADASHSVELPATTVAVTWNRTTSSRSVGALAAKFANLGKKGTEVKPGENQPRRKSAGMTGDSTMLSSRSEALQQVFQSLDVEDKISE